MVTDPRFDLSTETIPSSWHEAAAEAPNAHEDPPIKKKSTKSKPKPIRVMPNSESLDMFTATLLATVTCMIGGYIWYELEQSTGHFYPWTALLLAAAIALAVRWGGGQRDHQMRAILSLGVYFLGLTIILFILGRANYIELYRATPDFLDFEQHLYHSRLASPMAVTAWLSGALATVSLSYLTRSRAA